MSSGYGITNVLAGLGASAFSWSSGYTVGRDRLNDTIQDELASGSASAQASGQTLTLDAGAVTSISAIAILNHNLGTGSCAVQVQGADDAGFSVGIVTAKAASTINTSAPYQKDTVLQFPAVSKRYWRLTFTHSGTKTITIGELFLFSSITTLSRQSTWGAGESERYAQNRNESPTGFQRATYLGGPIRTMRLPFKDLVGTSQRDELLNMWRATRGGVSNLLYIDVIESTATAATAAGMQCIWGKMQAELPWSQVDFNLYDVAEFTITSQGREAGS